MMEEHRSSVSESISSMSSGFASMIGSPTVDTDVWSQMQELRIKMEALERQTGFPLSSSTPRTHHGRPRLDSTSSMGSTVIGSAHELQHGEIDLGPGGSRLFDIKESGDQLLMENTLKLTSSNVDTMSKYHNVVIKFAIVGEKPRAPEDCSCNRHNCHGSRGGIDASMYEELMKKLEEYQKQNQILQEENQELKRMSSHDKKVEDEEDDETNSILEVARETSKAEIEEIVTTQEEENQRYIIKSVMHPKTNEQISLNEAIQEGIVNLEKGLYVNQETGNSMDIPLAMSSNLIDVTYKITNRSPRKRSSYGVVTINKSVLPKGTLIIKSVKDTERDQLLSPEVAIKRKILDRGMTHFIDSDTGKRYHIVDAVEKGLVEIEDKMGQFKEPEKLSCVYKVSGVMDKKSGQMLTFHDAVVRGIMIKDMGYCKDTDSGKLLYVGYAIMTGMLKVDAMGESI